MSASEWSHRVYLIECLYKYNVGSLIASKEQSVETSLSFIDMYNRPFGIIKSHKGNKAVVATQGYVTLSYGRGRLVPGKYYYGNSRGQYLEGEWAGEQNVQSYFVYIENNNVKMITDVRNRIGVALSDNSMMLIPKQLRLLVC